jgi:hypothetical protein
MPLDLASLCDFPQSRRVFFVKCEYQDINILVTIHKIHVQRCGIDDDLIWLLWARPSDVDIRTPDGWLWQVWASATKYVRSCFRQRLSPPCLYAETRLTCSGLVCRRRLISVSTFTYLHHRQTRPWTFTTYLFFWVSDTCLVDAPWTDIGCLIRRVGMVAYFWQRKPALDNPDSIES